MNNTRSILFIDQEKSALSDLFTRLNESSEHRYYHVGNKEDLVNSSKINDVDIIFLDVTFENKETGLRILRKLRQKQDHVVVAVLPENDEHLTAKVIELNPFFYITKPYSLSEVTFALKRAVEMVWFSQRSARTSSTQNDFCGIIGKSSLMSDLYDLITRVADDDFSTVLIRGESGTGKELVAKAIHYKSNRKDNNFVPVNCAAIPDELLESELFGHTKGAFTGATQNKPGRIQYADKGTLFLDEIGDMKPNLQAKLLRVLQEKEFEPVGGLQSKPVNTRILAATHCDLEKLVEEGKFREDLYYRLSVIPLSIPPLTARREDIPLLIEAFIARYASDRGRESFSFSKSAMNKLLQYNWRGNVRELENLIQHMSILFSGKTVETKDLPEKFLLDENLSTEDFSHLTYNSDDKETGDDINLGLPLVDDDVFSNSQIDFNEIINDFEKKLIINALKATEGNKKEAAKLLKLKRTTLLEKIKKKNLSPDNW